MLEPRHPMSQTFHDVLDEMSELHDRKQSDYGRKDDPFANIRASEDFGIEGWVGAIIRANDKMCRLQKAAAGSTLTNETVEDSLLDLAVYAAIGLVLYLETTGPNDPKIKTSPSTGDTETRDQNDRKRSGPPRYPYQTPTPPAT